MNSRPKIKVELSTIDKTIELIAWLALAALWAFPLSIYSNLPEQIPTHFNNVGQVDSYGSKASILFLPIVGTLLFIGLTSLTNYPNIFNYPIKITEENAVKHYTTATRFIRFTKLLVVLVFLFISAKLSPTSDEIPQGLGMWFVPLSLGVSAIMLILYVLKFIRNK